MSRMLKDLSKITICKTSDKKEKIQDFLSQIEDPYHFMVGEVEVEVSFSEEGETLQDSAANAAGHLAGQLKAEI